MEIDKDLVVVEFVVEMVAELEVFLLLGKESIEFLEEFHELKESWNKNNLVHDGNAEESHFPLLR